MSVSELNHLLKLQHHDTGWHHKAQDFALKHIKVLAFSCLLPGTKKLQNGAVSLTAIHQAIALQASSKIEVKLVLGVTQVIYSKCTLPILQICQGEE
jgi:hypothetical protein